MVNLFPHPASFGFHLAMDTLAFGYILPTTGRIRVFHPLETCAARRTTKKGLHAVSHGVLSNTHFKNRFYFQLKFTRPIMYSAMTTIGTKYLKIGFIQS